MYQWIDLDGYRPNNKYTKIRTVPLIKWIDKYIKATDVVLDLGCNMGWHSIVAGQKAKKVIGIEILPDCIKQANSVKLAWEKQYNEKLDNVSFVAANINNRLDLLNDVTFLLAAKVLYHKGFRAGLHAFMNKVKSSKITTILAQGHSLTSRGRLGTVKGMTRLFKKYGFNTTLLEKVDGVRKKNEYPVVLARR